MIFWWCDRSTILNSWKMPTSYLMGLLVPCPYSKNNSTPARMAIIKRVMDVSKKGINFLNTSQMPVIDFDQPLNTLAKYSGNFLMGSGRANMLMIGGLHLECTEQLMVGKFLNGLEWDWTLSKAKMLTPGCVSSALNDQHIKRTLYCLVSLVAFSKLKKEA